MARATVQVVLLCLAVFAAQVAVALAVGAETMIALFALSLPLDANPWTVVTSVYAHTGPGHLVSNLLMFALLGAMIERHTSSARFHAFVLVTGVAAGLAQVAISDAALGVDTAVLGLSGAVFALLGYVITANRVSSGLFDRLDLPTWAMVLVFAVLAVVVTLATAAPRSALVGHFTGFLLGLLAGRANALRA